MLVSAYSSKESSIFAHLMCHDEMRYLSRIRDEESRWRKWRVRMRWTAIAATREASRPPVGRYVHDVEKMA